MDKSKRKVDKNIESPSNELFVHTYHVELLFDEIPKINPNNLLKDLQRICGNTRIDADTPDFLAFVFEDDSLKPKGKKDYPRCVLIKKDTALSHDSITNALAQTWDWPEKDRILKRCKYKIGFSDFLATELDNISRLKLFNNALLAILNNIHCMGIHWVNSQKLVSPKVFISALNDAGVQDYLYGALNVRLFVIDENSGEFIMDTFGLTAFGLPDLQCHFKGLNPEEVAGVLINYGYYIFEKGDIIADGHTVQGINEDQKWLCNHVKSMSRPFRKVLDLDPGGAFSGANKENKN